MEKEWLKQITPFLPTDYLAKMQSFMDQVYSKGVIYPPRAKVFAAFDHTSYANTKVLILGQDPYHGPGQAQGLSFSVPSDVKAPPSLQNILKELTEDIGIKENHDLTSWADQGVLLLNACLTVPEHDANGHQGLIWEPLTDAVIKALNEKGDPVVFLLWGGFAKKKRKLISNGHHLVIESAHPSPLSSYRGFFGSKPFSKTNNFLQEHHIKPIDWLV